MRTNLSQTIKFVLVSILGLAPVMIPSQAKAFVDAVIIFGMILSQGVGVGVVSTVTARDKIKISKGWEGVCSPAPAQQCGQYFANPVDSSKNGFKFIYDNAEKVNRFLKSYDRSVIFNPESVWPENLRELQEYSKFRPSLNRMNDKDAQKRQDKLAYDHFIKMVVSCTRHAARYIEENRAEQCRGKVEFNFGN